MTSHRKNKFTILNTSCNHTFDGGKEGLIETVNRLKKDQITNLGTRLEQTNRNSTVIINKNNIKIGFVAATLGVNGKPVPAGFADSINIVKFHDSHCISLEPLLCQIADCREKKCDFIIASLHWGYEYEFFPRKDQVKIAHQIVETGVGLILSHHPHVIQPYEFYRPEKKERTVVLITYSLGNLTNIKILCAATAIEAVEVKPSTREGDIIAHIAIAGSVITGIILLIVGLLLIMPLSKQLNNPVIKPAFE